MEASIMNGATLKAGCVTGVEDIMHPITAARLVMDKTPHNFLGFHGANKLIRQQNTFELLQPGALITENARQALEDWKRQGATPFAKTEIGHKRDEVFLDSCFD